MCLAASYASRAVVACEPRAARRRISSTVDLCFFVGTLAPSTSTSTPLSLALAGALRLQRARYFFLGLASLGGQYVRDPRHLKGLSTHERAPLAFLQCCIVGLVSLYGVLVLPLEPTQGSRL